MPSPTQEELNIFAPQYVATEAAHKANIDQAHAWTQAHSGLNSQQKALEAGIYNSLVSMLAAHHNVCNTNCGVVGLDSGGQPKDQN